MKYLVIVLLLMSFPVKAQEMYTLPGNKQAAWSSFENREAIKGAGGKENKGAKGHPSEMLLPGESKTLLNVSGAGIIQRIWMTLSERSPEMLRSIRVDMFWDNETKAAVSVPVGDFFGIGLGRTTAFQNALFSNPEGRSFNCIIPMPFKKAARIVLVNESAKPANLFYDINFTRVSSLPSDALYFHAYWNRNTETMLGEDFNILPRIQGKGRFLGCNLGIITHPSYGKSWWGEGEVKMYLDGDTELASLVGSGTEDYIGTAWGQGAYAQMYQGSPIADTTNNQWAFYRYHIPDPIYFYSDLRVSIQQMGGDMTDKVKGLAQAGAKLIPVTVAQENKFIKLLELNPVPKLSASDFPQGWTNFYRLDNYSSTAYFYLDSPSNKLPALRSLKERTEGILKN